MGIKYYLEISPRQSGKTFRLVQTAAAHAVNHGGQKTAIVCPNSKMKRNLIDKYSSDLRAEEVKNNDSPNYFCNGYLNVYSLDEFKTRNIGRPIEENLEVFYDEFDFMNPSDLTCSPGYYVTTPKFLRDCSEINKLTEVDPLIKLWIKIGVVHSYHGYAVGNFNLIVDAENEREELMSPDAYKTEILGQWLK